MIVAISLVLPKTETLAAYKKLAWHSTDQIVDRSHWNTDSIERHVVRYSRLSEEVNEAEEQLHFNEETIVAVKEVDEAGVCVFYSARMINYSFNSTTNTFIDTEVEVRTAFLRETPNA